MKKELSPVVIIISVLVLVCTVVFFFWQSGNTTNSEKVSPSMPPQVAAELQKRLGGVQPPGMGGNGSAAPSANPGVSR